MEDPYKIFRVLIKFMDEQYVDSFLNDGLLFMNNIDYFRSYEDADVALRGDIHEGLAATYKAEGLTITLGDHVVEGAVGKVDLRYNHEGDTNIYSMTKISDGKILEAGDSGLFLSENFIKFGNRAVVIGGSNIIEFEKRLRNALAKDQNIYTPREDNVLAKQVSYLSREEHHGQMDVFDKFSDYSWQHEWRIAFKQKQAAGPYPLKIGNLSDIASVFETESLIREPLKLVPSNL
ncbi:MAG: hypothetical protein CBB95_09855 [Alteromonas sp. TMED35]|jgi:hypothetical protein|uniref:hypothetical protein n=1 Tax=uncultured Alteromonas sp. TaxID=179113 RepID=UPI000B680E26|nr:MAG: hypothetical protein CBB95_09855 [Alteromonas sp. TMED35]|tara:strand:- start:1910 stop:2611 length:702 start_codon:yes stop_codon:yes gene_type:complete